MAARKLNFEAIEQGATFYQVLQITDTNDVAIDLTDVTAKMQIRSNYSNPVISELSTANGKITINEAGGEITLQIPASETETFTPGTVIYDLEIYWPSGRTDRLIEGSCLITAEVTR